MAEVETKVMQNIRAFFEGYWLRVRKDLWGEAHSSVVRALVGRFEHSITVCPDGVLVVLQHSSSDSFHWIKSSEGVLDLTKEKFGSVENRKPLDMEGLVPGYPGQMNFDLDVALNPDREAPLDMRFDRIQLRFVPFSVDKKFWAGPNAERLAERNLKGRSNRV